MYRVALSKAEGVMFQNADDQKEFGDPKMIAARTRSAIFNGCGVDINALP